ncbi:putative serine/threonine-protein kinase [Zingiber officinale]|uniref:putative serine/threonine-protein kinase n=1 Tax=Zingiber officinale TaxID=94328 RepID=UPI001C4CC2A1|nr:putative serine/threonine-protein kinase [Zingiber officinale]
MWADARARVVMIPLGNLANIHMQEATGRWVEEIVVSNRLAMVDEELKRLKATGGPFGSQGPSLLFHCRCVCFVFHELTNTTIIHHSIKASNILLDGQWTTKIVDFGMTHLFLEDQTHAHTRAASTNDYMTPEYVMNDTLSIKADVFSFGC